jgi:hypothetical protein
MRPSFFPALLSAVLFSSLASFAADQKPSSQAQEMTRQTRMDLIKNFNAELVYARTTFPIGSKGLTLKNGKIAPSGKDLQEALAMYGPSVKPGDQAMITDIRIKSDRIHFEINGGPIKRKKWYQRIQVGMGSGTVQAPDDPRTNSRGSFVDLVFDRYVPEMSPQELKALLRPALDFDAKSAVEAYLETVPPKVKEAIQNHNVLVGMNREMVTYSKGRPPKKIREKDKDADIEYEEWIYGDPPKDVEFIRLVGDEVIRVEVMKVGGEKIVHTEKEVDLGTEPSLAKGPEQPDVRPVNAPSLRRPGEVSDPNPRTAPGPDPKAPPMPPQPPPDAGGSNVPQWVGANFRSIHPFYADDSVR